MSATAASARAGGNKESSARTKQENKTRPNKQARQGAAAGRKTRDRITLSGFRWQRRGSGAAYNSSSATRRQPRYLHKWLADVDSSPGTFAPSAVLPLPRRIHTHAHTGRQVSFVHGGPKLGGRGKLSGRVPAGSHPSPPAHFFPRYFSRSFVLRVANETSRMAFRGSFFPWP